MVHAAPAAPPLRDRSVDLDHLQRMARTCDAIGDEMGGARYPAVALVQWLADEYAATRRRPRPEDQPGTHERGWSELDPGRAPLHRGVADRQPPRWRRSELTAILRGGLADRERTKSILI